MSVSLARLARATLVAAASATLAGCASLYVDPTLPRVGKADLPAVAAPRPVQLLYEFRTRGNVNARATEATRKYAEEVVAESGLFSAVSATPVEGRRLLITIDNVPLTSGADAKTQGFITGLTLGLVGTNTTDGYLCTATFEEGGSVRAKARAEHALHGTIGAAEAPKGATPVPLNDAAKTVVEQLTWYVLKEIAGAMR